MKLFKDIYAKFGTQDRAVFVDPDIGITAVDAFYKRASEQILAKALSDRQAAVLKTGVTSLGLTR